MVVVFFNVRMRKLSPKTKTPKNPKQKRLIRDANVYLKPGALAQLRNSKASASGSGSKSKSCMDLGKKRVAVLDAENDVGGGLFENKSGNETAIILSPQRFRYGPVDKENSIQRTPSTPRPEEGNGDYESQLESLPMELLVVFFPIFF
ncbi:F-box domain, cyclin-like protein [Artemisia annua]|uniref:F-box domain, cyclin-like protein n=1 Tax=Artemisia annua TaxID=35608 RepID=A0A2U1KZP0_ARTAN|nr:F-box domain, cyclin-like protein [Artemisia annua]